MNVLVFTGIYLPGFKGGGPIKTIKNLIATTNDSISYKVITSDRDLGDSLPYAGVKLGVWNKLNDSEVYYIQPGIKGIGQITKLMNQISFDLVYLNSFFSPRFSLLPLLLSKLLKFQLVVGPRGEFSEGALSIKAPKKKAFITLYNLFNLSKDIVFQASSLYEAEDIRKALGSKVDIFVAEDIGSQEFASTLPKKEQIIKAIFISRISPKKNLTTALKILKKVQRPLIYDIYGPIEDRNYWQTCQNIIAELPSNIIVQYKGELTPDKVVSTLSLYDFFFMPTEGENYGHVIAEALCAGLPLLISNTTPWRDLENLGIGWDLPLDNLDVYSKKIDSLAEMPDDQHHKMRKTVLDWAQQKFAQRDAIEANINMFRYAYNKKKGLKDAI